VRHSAALLPQPDFAIPGRGTSLSNKINATKSTNQLIWNPGTGTRGRYAIYWNAVHQSSGHAWQGRYYSCPLDRVHLWEALLYGVEPGARRLDERGGSVGLVQRGSALRSGSAERDIRFGGMAEKLDRQRLAAVPGGR
jgi:hypothetical protein